MSFSVFAELCGPNRYKLERKLSLVVTNFGWEELMLFSSVTRNHPWPKVRFLSLPPGLSWFGVDVSRALPRTLLEWIVPKTGVRQLHFKRVSQSEGLRQNSGLCHHTEDYDNICTCNISPS